MSNELGANLSPYAGLEFFVGNSPEQLLAQLKSIRVPFKLIAIYAQGPNHVAWIDSGAIKLKKTKKPSKE